VYTLNYKIQNQNVMLATDYISLMRVSRWETYKPSKKRRD